ncbi:hypothetical protein PHLGIDRAFT_106848 [Phlebiopsis gigantea 11061_1 CR5-6]|uniref:Cupin type-2 domain-containing protein n=1 Tax=Phlebiopsis gigantea (strain 11061_1 CR5-6) TaxID=745531 RepID=A0A0C3S9Y0_PHLG1|nr:hypothetical protein PHLGIDRAFT_106848 [Phlebiopsis gigantea 11061_1 CR5-6]
MSTTPSTTPGLPQVRRVVTGHTPEGKAIVVEDGTIAPRDRGMSQFIDLGWTTDCPANNNGEFTDEVKDHVADIYSETGSSFRAVDVPPGGGSIFHRTVTIDYGIVHSGKITCILDDGERVYLNAGDVILQRGTIHKWANETDEWTRMYFVMLPSTKVKVGERELEQEFHPPSTA